METNAHGQTPTLQKIKGKHDRSEEDQIVVVGIAEMTAIDIETVAREETLAIPLEVIVIAILLEVGRDPEDQVPPENLLKAVFAAGPLRDEIMQNCAISF